MRVFIEDCEEVARQILALEGPALHEANSQGGVSRDEYMRNLEAIGANLRGMGALELTLEENGTYVLKCGRGVPSIAGTYREDDARVVLSVPTGASIGRLPIDSNREILLKKANLALLLAWPFLRLPGPVRLLRVP